MPLPSWMNNNRATYRAPVNPMDKATIVSVYPREIDEKKHTIYPGRFIVPAGTSERPGILVVGPSSWWREVDTEQPLLEIPTSAIVVADSVVKDYCNGILGCNMGDAMLGIFYIPGEYNILAIKKSYQHEIDNAVRKQKNWYSALIKLADSLWARSNGNPLVISNDMRMAARELGQHETKDWMKHHHMVEMVRCKACGALKNPLYPVCQTCKAVDDPERAKALGLTFAS